MLEAISLAKQAALAGEVPVGAVIVKDGKIEFDDLDRPEQSAIVSLIRQASDKVRASHISLPFWKKICEKIKSWFDF